MNLLQYREIAHKSMKQHATPEIAMADWALGLGGEFGEVVELLVALVNNEMPDAMEIAKELGDVIWYVVALADHLKLALPEDLLSTPSTLPTGDLARIQILIGKVQEFAKHTIAHKENLNNELVKQYLLDIMLELHALCANLKFQLADVAELNAMKLQHRYGGGTFSHSASANRHAQEEKFSDTEVYVELAARLLLGGDEHGN